ncbi:MAG: hypothetical protein R6U44_08875 [Archaeoglobaceae archaeon]
MATVVKKILFFKQIYEVITTASYAQAEWELEVSKGIIGDRTKVLVLVLILLPALIIHPLVAP